MNILQYWYCNPYGDCSMSTRYPAAYRPGAQAHIAQRGSQSVGGTALFNELVGRSDASREFHRLAQLGPREGPHVPRTLGLPAGVPTRPPRGARVPLRLLRLHPAVRAMQTAWDVYQTVQPFMNRPASPGGWSDNGWNKVFEYNDANPEHGPSANFAYGAGNGGPQVFFDHSLGAQNWQQALSDQAWWDGGLKWVCGFWDEPGTVVFDFGVPYRSRLPQVTYEKPQGTQFPKPTVFPGMGPDVAPLYDGWSKPAVNPAWNPEAVRPLGWAGPAVSLPYKAIPYRPPLTATQFGRQPPRPPGPPPVREPPPPGTKERKMKSNLPGIILAIQKAGHTVTEALDAIDAIWKALPSKYRKGDKTPQDKLESIYKHFDKIDLQKAMLNLIANHISDAVVGRISGGAQKYATENGVILGRTGMEPVMSTPIGG